MKTKAIRELRRKLAADETVYGLWVTLEWPSITLFAALSERRIAGAAVDCFEVEPVTTPHRFAELDNVLLAPHSIAWTHELFRDTGKMACRSMLDLARGRRPHGSVNAEVLDRPSFQRKWERLSLAESPQS